MIGVPGRGSELGIGAVYRRLARNSAYLATGTVVSSLLMMAAAVLNARALSAREFGTLVLFQSATMLLTTLTTFSTQQPVIKLGSMALADGDLQRLGRIIGLGLLLDLLAAGAATLIALAVLLAGQRWIGLDDAQLALASLFAASLLFSGYLTSNGIFRLLNHFAWLSLIQAGCAAAILVATVGLYASGARFELYCWAWALFYAANGQVPVFVAIRLARRAGIPIALSPRKMDSGELSTFVAYCWTTWGTATIDGVRSNGDSLLVGGAVSVEAAGVYNVAKQLAGVLRKFNTVYASAAFPEISALSAHGQDDSSARLRRRMLWVSAGIALIAVAAALLAGGPVLALLFGERFERAWLPLVILTVAAASQLISFTLSMYVQVYVGPERLFSISVAAITIFLLAVFPLTAAFSLEGTAVAQLIFSLAMIYLCHSALRKEGAAKRTDTSQCR